MPLTNRMYVSAALGTVAAAAILGTTAHLTAETPASPPAAAPVPPGALRASPQTLQAQLQAAHGGETIALEPGNYGDLLISWRKYPRRVTIDASRADFVRIVLRQVENLTIAGGTVTAPRDMQHSVAIDFSKNVTITGMHISGARIGTLISRSQYVDVTHNDYSGTRSDGVNIAMSQHVQIIGNICRNFNPMLGKFDAAGKEIAGGDHPDCVQAWSRPNFPPTSDVLVTDNTAEGFMQGIFFGDPGNGGYDRIVIRDNHIKLSVWSAIVVYEGRDIVVTGNDVSTIPGSKWIAYPFRPIIAHIKMINSTNVRACGNRVEQPRDSDGTKRC